MAPRNLGLKRTYKELKPVVFPHHLGDIIGLKRTYKELKLTYSPIKSESLLV